MFLQKSEIWGDLEMPFHLSINGFCSFFFQRKIETSAKERQAAGTFAAEFRMRIVKSLPWIPEALKKGKSSGSAATRPRSNTSCSTSLWYSNLSDFSGQLKYKRTFTTATTDSLQLLKARGD